MLILGTNGWPEGGSSASAVILEDGSPLLMIEEERVSRVKQGENTAPHASIDECLRRLRLSWEDIDHVAHGFDVHAVHAAVGRSVDGAVEDILLPDSYHRSRRRPPLHLVPHHIAHAASGFFSSGFGSAAIVVCDGSGETASTTIALGRGHEITPLLSIDVTGSLGFFYEAATELAGLGTWGQGKLMGLAPYGRVRTPIDAFRLTSSGYEVPGAASAIRPVGHRFGPDVEPIKEWWTRYLEKRRVSDTEPFRNADLAAETQTALEDVLLHTLSLAIELTGERRVVLAGGVALNCSANGRMARSGLAKDLFVPSVAADAGVSLGAAQFVYAELAGRASPWRMNHAYLGAQVSQGSFRDAVADAGLEYRQLDRRKVIDETVSIMEQGGIVAWFHGRAEVGPRALGHRSILGDPRSTEVRDRLNVLKGREAWRPLAPSVRSDAFSKYFDGARRSPFMLLALPVVPAHRRQLAGITHVDGSARPQSVTRSANRRYWDLLSAWEQVSGHPVLMNTSFNLAGEPIVHTAANAVASFVEGGFDALVLGNGIVRRR